MQSADHGQVLKHGLVPENRRKIGNDSYLPTLLLITPIQKMAIEKNFAMSWHQQPGKQL